MLAWLRFVLQFTLGLFSRMWVNALPGNGNQWADWVSGFVMVSIHDRCIVSSGLFCCCLRDVYPSYIIDRSETIHLRDVPAGHPRMVGVSGIGWGNGWYLQGFHPHVAAKTSRDE